MAFTLDELYNMQSAQKAAAEAAAQTDADAVDAVDVVEGLDAVHAGVEVSGTAAAVTVKTPPAVATHEGSPTAGEELLRVRELEAQLQEAQAEVFVLRDHLADAKTTSGAADPFQEEMIELLRDEMTQLQAEVTERDAQLQELRHNGNAAEAGPTAPVVSGEELQKLCTRLEDLLGELDQKDDQVTVLQKHLQSAEDVAHAEQDERRQLEGWVGEIEERITARDRDWEVKLSEMSMRLTQARSERREAEKSSVAGTDDTRVEALQRVVTELRDEKDELVSQLDEANEKVRDLERAVENADQDAERLESVQLCQERAEIARQRFDLEKLQQEMDEQKAVEGSDLRIRALRDHLKEVHATEEVEKKEAYSKSLAGRVTSLWKRLENR